MRKILVLFGFLCVVIITHAQADSTFSAQPLDRLAPDGSDYSESVDSLWVRFLDSHQLIYNYRINLDTAKVIKHIPDSVYHQRFAELDNLSPFDLSYNPAVEKYINEYLRYSRHLKKVMGLAEYYFPILETELDAQGMPLELKYLSVIESALNPTAKSPVGASGLWQFMLPTGRECGLTVNSYIDERNDPKAATKAACEYLSRLYEIYGVWELAISAYNCGPGNVNKAIRSAGGSKNYWAIRPFLPRETQKYVPRFMSMVYLMNYGEQHNIMPVVPDFSYWKVDTVVVNEQMSFGQISSRTNIKLDELSLLNPQFSKQIVPKKTGGTVLVLPASKVQEFDVVRETIATHKPSKTAVYISNVDENKIQSPPRKNKTQYTVRSGDVLGTIAEKHGVSVSQLRSWNRISGTRIKVGQKLVIYQPKLEAKETPSNVSGPYSYYVVKKGDTLWDIAKLYPGVSMEQIRKWNTHVNPKNLKTGSKLKIKLS